MSPTPLSPPPPAAGSFLTVIIIVIIALKLVCPYYSFANVYKAILKSVEKQVPIMNDKTNVLILAALAVVVLTGTLVMYGIESRAPNSHIKTFLDALWWCIATVTTVGYGDITPVTIVGRVVALIYMFFGIAMISLVLSMITDRYRKKFQKDELGDQEKEMLYLRDLVADKLSEIEKIQSQILELVNRSQSSSKN